MIEINRLIALLNTLIRGGGANKIAMAEVTLEGGAPGLIVFASGRGVEIAQKALTEAAPREFKDLKVPNHAEN